tara:strand:+ start:318 stop:518 length:201 start_codon:yes stop_codon:yes gene_type:complete
MTTPTERAPPAITQLAGQWHVPVVLVAVVARLLVVTRRILLVLLARLLARLASLAACAVVHSSGAS